MYNQTGGEGNPISAYKLPECTIHLPSHSFVAFCIISCTATVVVRTVAAAGCFGGATAASANPGSSAGSWKQIKPAAEPAAAGR